MTARPWNVAGSAGVIGALAVTIMTGCGSDGEDEASPVASAPAEATAFVVTSTDFADGGALPASAKATAFSGQCTGDNVSPQLEWSGAPAGTESFAIVMLDPDAGSFVHWTKANIPATVTSVPAGGADALAGIGGSTGQTVGTYFGPCPPDGEHRYTFTVYALDTATDLEDGFELIDLNLAMSGHVLAEATITGVSAPDA